MKTKVNMTPKAVAAKIERLVRAARGTIAFLEKMEYDSILDLRSREAFDSPRWRRAWEDDGTGECQLVEALRAACDALVPPRRAR